MIANIFKGKTEPKCGVINAVDALRLFPAQRVDGRTFSQEVLDNEVRDWIQGNMTLDQAVSDHDGKWFGGTGSSFDHDSIHVLLALASPNFSYQGSFEAEMYVLTFQAEISNFFCSDPRDGGFILKNNFHDKVRGSAKEFILRENLTRTLAWMIGDAMRISSNEVRWRANYDDDRIRHNAVELGLVINSDDTSWSVSNNRQNQPYYFKDSGDFNLPANNGFDLFKFHSDLESLGVSNKLYRALQHIYDKSSDHSGFDDRKSFFKNILVSDLYDAMHEQGASQKLVNRVQGFQPTVV